MAKKLTNTTLKLMKVSALIVPLILISAVFFREYLFLIADKFPKCWFHQTTGFLCPACGNTRSVEALLKGQILKSIQYNIMPILCCIIGLTFYIELLLQCKGKHKAIFPRSYCFLIILISILCLYFVLRNFIPFLTICEIL